MNSIQGLQKRSKFLIPFLCMFLCLGVSSRGLQVAVTTPDGHVIPLYGNSYALVVGNGNYSRGWDPLPGAIRDVKEVAQTLVRHGFSVTLETDLTKEAFNKVFTEFSLKYGTDEKNRLLFYYAGHGHTQTMATGEELGCLVMVDAPAPEKDLLGFNLSSVDMQSLVTQAKMIKARHVLFIFDSCFSGSILNLRERVVPRNVSESVRYPVRQFITAGRSNEPVPDHSVFKQAFLDLLEGRDLEPIPDGYVTGEELGLYLKNKVPEYNPAQHPQYGKIKDPRLDKGDFIFVLKAPSRPAAAPAPPQPKGVRNYDKIIEERKAVKEWDLWQGRMDEEFAKVEKYDRSEELTAKEKTDAWEEFLSSYGSDNPYSAKDDRLREEAQERLAHRRGVEKVFKGKEAAAKEGKHASTASPPIVSAIASSSSSQKDDILSQTRGKIVFTEHKAHEGGYDYFLCLVNVDGSGLREVLHVSHDQESYEPCFTTSPDGSRVAYFSPKDYLSTLSLETGEEKETTYAPPGGKRYIAWSPDSARIAFVANCDLYVVNADGSAEKELASRAQGKYSTLVGVRVWSDQIRNPVWASSGDTILFDDFAVPPEISAWGGVEAVANRRVKTVGVSSGAIRNLVEHAVIVCSNGKRLVIRTKVKQETVGSGQYIIMNIDGSEQKELKKARDVGFAALAPDGSALAYAASGVKKGYPGSIYLLDVSKDDYTMDNDYVSNLVWSCDGKYILYSYFGRGHDAWKKLSFGEGFNSTPEIRLVDRRLYPSKTVYRSEEKVKINVVGWLRASGGG